MPIGKTPTAYGVQNPYAQSDLPEVPKPTPTGNGGGGTVTAVTATPPIASSGGTAPNITHLASGVAAALYGDATHVGQFTVDADGHVTLAANVLITGVAPSGAAGGDLSGTYPNPTVAKINTVALGSTVATAGNILIGSGTAWVTNPVSGGLTLTSGGVGAVVIDGLSAKTTPVAADEFILSDSAAAFTNKKITYADLTAGITGTDLFIAVAFGLWR